MEETKRIPHEESTCSVELKVQFIFFTRNSSFNYQANQSTKVLDDFLAKRIHRRKTEIDYNIVK